MDPLPLTIIAAVARNGVIGLSGTLPWRLPGEMAHFRTRTAGKPVLMGRKTFEPINKALPGRALIVVSHRPLTVPAGVLRAADLDEAVATASTIGRAHGAAEIMVAGGAAIYEQTIGRASTMLLTEIDLEPTGDAVFPTLNSAEWREVERLRPKPVSGDHAGYDFVTFIRVKEPPTV